MQDCAVRLEPPPPLDGEFEAPPVAAVLLVAGARWSLQPPTVAAAAVRRREGAKSHQDAEPPPAGLGGDAAQPTKVVLASLSLWVANAEGTPPSPLHCPDSDDLHTAYVTLDDGLSGSMLEQRKL